MDIVIRYCAERGFEEPALVFARRLFAEFDDAIASLALEPIADDDLTVSLDGQPVYSFNESGRLPRISDLGGKSQKVSNSGMPS
jgi:predicted Rdx family selenoprotein